MSQEIRNEHEMPESDTQDDNPQSQQSAALESKPDYTDFMPQLRPKPRWPRAVGWTLLVLIALAGIGFGGWKWDQHKNTPASNHHPTQHHATTSTIAAPSTTSYTSNNFNLTLAYPQNWNLTDNGKLIITSPAVELKAASGQNQTGQITLSVESQSSADMSAFDKGNAVAVLASQKVAYNQPSSTQRADTYVSFLQYAATTMHGALDGVYVTGDNGYEYGQIIPESDIVKIDPLIRITFVSCQDAKCTTTKPLSITSTEWSDTSFSTPIISMIKSLQLN